MENLDESISLRKFEDDDIYEIFDAALQKKISLYVQSTGSHHVVLLSTSQLQQIRSNHPQKFKMFIEELVDYSSPRLKTLDHFQLVHFSDLWIKKTEAVTILNKPLSSASSNNTPVSESNSTPAPESNNTSTSDYEKSTMLKMILGMAKAAYGFIPGERRNLATGSKKGSIKADLEKMGFEITEDTVRKYLNEAVKKHLPDVVCEN